MGPESTPAIEDMLMIRPAPLAFMPGITAWLIATIPNTLTSKPALRRSRGTLVNGAMTPSPALLMSTSGSSSPTPPTSAGSVTSSFIAVSSGCSAPSASACAPVSVVAITR